MRKFTAHNIRLDDGSFTRKEKGIDMSQHPVMLICKRVIEEHYPNQTYIGRRIVDIGCLEGGYTVELARMGLDAVGIEVRQSNFDNCIYVKSKVDLSNLTFVHDDAWNIEKYGRFDIVFCCGLLYHMENPKRYLNILSKICDELLVIDTHFSVVETKEKFNLSDLEIHEGLKGRFYQEYSDPNKTQNENAKWAAWENHRSFWPLYNDLMDAISDVGFSKVYEVESPTRGIHNQRATIIALKD